MHKQHFNETENYEAGIAGEAISNVYYELGEKAEQLLEQLANKNLAEATAEERNKILDKMELLAKVGLHKEIVQFIEEATPETRKIISQDLEFSNNLSKKGYTELSQKLLKEALMTGEISQRNTWQTGRQVTTALRSFIEEGMPPEEFLDVYFNSREQFKKGSFGQKEIPREMDDLIKGALNTYGTQLEDYPEHKDRLWNAIQTSREIKPELLASWGVRMGEQEKCFSAIMQEIDSRVDSPVIWGRYAKAAIQLCYNPQERTCNFDNTEEISNYLSSKMNPSEIHTQEKSAEEDIFHEYRETNSPEDGLEITQEIAKLLTELEIPYPSVITTILNKDHLASQIETYIKAMENYCKDTTDYTLDFVRKDLERVKMEFQTLFNKAGITTDLKIPASPEQDIPTSEIIQSFDDLYDNLFLEEMRDLWSNLQSEALGLKGITKDTAEDFSKILNIFSRQKPWVKKFLQLSLKRAGLFSEGFVNFFLLPDNSEERSLPIEKTGSGLEISLTGPQEGTIYRTINPECANVWKYAAENIATEDSGILVGVEPFEETDTNASTTAKIKSRFCGYTLGDMRMLLAEMPSEKVEQIQDSLAEVMTRSIINMEQIGINHGHPHIANFTIEFWPKNIPMEPGDINTLKNADKYIQDPREWQKSPDDYIVICRIIDFDRATLRKKTK